MEDALDADAERVQFQCGQMGLCWPTSRPWTPFIRPVIGRAPVHELLPDGLTLSLAAAATTGELHKAGGFTRPTLVGAFKQSFEDFRTGLSAALHPDRRHAHGLAQDRRSRAARPFVHRARAAGIWRRVRMDTAGSGGAPRRASHADRSDAGVRARRLSSGHDDAPADRRAGAPAAGVREGGQPVAVHAPPRGGVCHRDRRAERVLAAERRAQSGVRAARAVRASRAPSARAGRVRAALARGAC